MPLFSSAFYLLAIALSGVAARAVDTNITSIPASNISSSMLFNSSNVTVSSQRCTDIDTCRTKNQIVVSCLVTILACVWFAVHRNVPAPSPKPSQHPRFIVRSALRAWAVVRRQREAVIVTVVALIAPEWILAWAIRQAMVAWALVRKLEQAMEVAVKAQEERCSDLEKNKGNVPSTVHATCEQCEGNGNQCHRVAAEHRVAKGKEGWTWTHGFFIGMGGFLFYDTEGPLYPLSPTAVIELVRRGHLVPPTADEISNQSKGDALSKGVAVVQTLWFVVQCLARSANHLPVTNLEIMTLGYTVMTVAMYAAWWKKPLNVNCAVRVPEEEIGRYEALGHGSIWMRITMYIMGGQDQTVDLRQDTRVPTFWAGRAGGLSIRLADAIALLVTMVFGAVHCLAWHSDFPSPLEQQLWRSSAIVVTAFPVALVVFAAPAALSARIYLRVEGAANVLLILLPVVWISWLFNEVTNLLASVMYPLLTIIYVTARLTLLTLSFTSLGALPFGAYQTVEWTAFIPHI